MTLTYRSWSEGHHDLYFTFQWFCLISWRLFDVWTSFFKIMGQYDLMFDLKINIGLCDLYFMVQWFCLISWTLFDTWTPYFVIMSQYDPMFDLKINEGDCDLYFMVQLFCLISWKLMKTVWCMIIITHLDYESVWPDVWPQNIYRAQWPIFHGPVILLYILKTVWCLNIMLCDNESSVMQLLP